MAVELVKWDDVYIACETEPGLQYELQFRSGMQTLAAWNNMETANALGLVCVASKHAVVRSCACKCFRVCRTALLLERSGLSAACTAVLQPLMEHAVPLLASFAAAWLVSPRLSSLLFPPPDRIALWESES